MKGHLEVETVDDVVNVVATLIHAFLLSPLPKPKKAKR